MVCGTLPFERHCELLPDVEPTLQQLAARHRIMMFTKGQRDEQLQKLQRSGLAPLFERVETPREWDLDQRALQLGVDERAGGDVPVAGGGNGQRRGSRRVRVGADCSQWRD